jgi:hypothetical protein
VALHPCNYLSDLYQDIYFGDGRKWNLGLPGTRSFAHTPPPPPPHFAPCCATGLSISPPDEEAEVGGDVEVGGIVGEPVVD